MVGVLATLAIVLAVLAINKRTARLEQPPEVVMRGFGGADIGPTPSTPPQRQGYR
jgi:hypothetical protein